MTRSSGSSVDHPGHRGPRPADSRPCSVLDQRPPVGDRRQRQARVTAQPREALGQLRHEGRRLAPAGEERLGEHLGQGGVVGGAQGGTVLGGQLEATRAQLGTDVVHRDVARGQGRAQAREGLGLAPRA